MQLLALGLNHTTAPLSIREAVSFAPEEIPGALGALLDAASPASEGGVREALILATCNRTEFFLAAENADAAVRTLCSFIAERKHISLQQFMPHTYCYQQSDVARHTFRVASGLDSMVLGETQIVGQMKKAWRIAKDSKALGLMLGHLFDSTFAAAKEVRTATSIGAHSVSLAAAGVRMAEQLFGDLSRERVLFVGAGEMIELCAAHFCARHPAGVTVANRTLERGAALARRFHAQAVELRTLPDIVSGYDIIVSCTASSLPIIGLGMIQKAVAERRHRPMMIIDLAVPRDVEAEVSSLDDIYYYTVDDLGKVVASGKESRRVAVTQAEAIIEMKVGDFEAWLAARDAVPEIRALRARAEAIRESELQKAVRRIASGADAAEVLKAFSHSLTNKLIHDPTSLLRNGTGLSEEERAKESDILKGFYRSRESRA
ncbi:MAG: glutamyl-tRNA reductase [Sutterellaceae bacterium]|nr:glutamyl-tRNA reductase [Sutterellaceae bacterium]MDY2868792.1 glutamyl-tRNA reductase [Mesosutterella sp.]